MIGKLRNVLMSLIVWAVIFVCGCQNYEVTDKESGQMYYTTSIHHKHDGSVTFKDEKSNRKVTLQSPDVRKIGKPFYDAHVHPDRDNQK